MVAGGGWRRAALLADFFGTRFLEQYFSYDPKNLHEYSPP
jgi:hypothetical protein